MDFTLIGDFRPLISLNPNFPSPTVPDRHPVLLVPVLADDPSGADPPGQCGAHRQKCHRNGHPKCTMGPIPLPRFVNGEYFVDFLNFSIKISFIQFVFLFLPFCPFQVNSGLPSSTWAFSLASSSLHRPPFSRPWAITTRWRVSLRFSNSNFGAKFKLSFRISP